jgi:hypothetical protein
MTQYSLHGKLGGPQGRSGQVRKTLPPPVLNPQIHKACSESLHWLSYPSSYDNITTNHKHQPFHSQTCSPICPSHSHYKMCSLCPTKQHICAINSSRYNWAVTLSWGWRISRTTSLLLLLFTTCGLIRYCYKKFKYDPLYYMCSTFKLSDNFVTFCVTLHEYPHLYFDWTVWRWLAQVNKPINIIYSNAMTNKFTAHISTASYTHTGITQTDTVTILLSLLHTKIPASDSSHQ